MIKLQVPSHQSELDYIKSSRDPVSIPSQFNLVLFCILQKDIFTP